MNQRIGPSFNSPHFSSHTLATYQLAWARSLEAKVIISVPFGQIIDCNPAAEKLLQTTKGDLLSKHLWDLAPSEERNRVIEELRSLPAVPQRIEGFHAATSNGHVTPILISTSGIIELRDGSLISICELQDISLLKEHEHRLATKRWALSAYASAAVTLSKEHSREGLFASICDAIVTEPNYVFAWIAIADKDEAKTIRVAAQAGPAVSILDGIHLSWSADDPASQGPTPTAIRTGKLQTVPDTKEMTVYSPWTDRFGKFGIRSCASIPFCTPEGFAGAIVVCAMKPKAFDPIALEVFTHLAEQLGHGLHAVEQQELLAAEREHSAATDKQLCEAMWLMVEPMSLAMEMRDPHTAGHQKRVAEIAVMIASEMGWSPERQKGLRLAALVHDIGKMSIPGEILTKPGRLSKTERALLNEHCENGYNILKGIPFGWPIAAIALQHHEKLDGSGYPNGLTAGEILPESKILAVADMFEAMTAHRPYRPAIPVETVLDLLEADAGIKLDSEAVRICALLSRQGLLDRSST